MHVFATLKIVCFSVNRQLQYAPEPEHIANLLEYRYISYNDFSENSFRSVVPQPQANGFFSIHSVRQNTDHEIEVKIQ